MASSLSLELSKDTADKVHRIAEQEHRSVSDTVRILTEEAIKMREFSDITFTDGPTGRHATFIDDYESYPDDIEERIALNQGL